MKTSWRERIDRRLRELRAVMVWRWQQIAIIKGFSILWPAAWTHLAWQVPTSLQRSAATIERGNHEPD
jgi:hypothetical protein